MTHPHPVVVVLGTLGQVPFAGTAWQVLQYLEGFRRAGADVYYVEDTGAWPYDAERETVTADCSFTLRYIARLMDWAGFGDRWAYRAAAENRRVHGMTDAGLEGILDRANALVNLTGSTILRDEHLRVPVRVYLETDPVLAQIEVATGKASTIDHLAAHTHHFSFGENLGAPDCAVPLERFHYLPTRQPIVLEWWSPRDGSPGRDADRKEGHAPYTTIANWKQSGKDFIWKGETYTWSKHHEFLKFIDLPKRTKEPFELALKCDDAESLALLRENGWRVIDALALSRDIHVYRDYIVGSYGEFTVAKDQNVRLRSGWFSDRAACYLAAGRPVINQDTAFGAVLPMGEGLFAFRKYEDIERALEAIRSDYARHSRAAREIAREYFDAPRVVRSLLDRVGL